MLIKNEKSMYSGPAVKGLSDNAWPQIRQILTH